MASASEAEKPKTMQGWFGRIAQATSRAAGHPITFLLALGTTVAWAFAGPALHYSDTWQLIITTLSSVITYLMVFVLQNSQNRESKAMQLKLDEIIRSLNAAHNELIDIENVSDDELEQLARRYEQIRTETERRQHGRRRDPAA